MELSSAQSLNKIGNPQNRATHFLFNDNDSTYEDMLEKHGCPDLHLRRQRTLCIEIYKVK